jgi:hypothetical protein
MKIIAVLASHASNEDRTGAAERAKKQKYLIFIRWQHHI